MAEPGKNPAVPPEDDGHLDYLRDTIKESEDDLLPIFEEVRTHTLRARKAMDTSPADLNTLANEIVELSILMQRLGDRIAMAGYIARDARNYYERIRENHKVRLTQEHPSADGKRLEKPVAAGVADSMKMQLSQEEFEVYNQAEYNLDKAVMLRKSTDKTIDAIRSKLSFEKIDYHHAS